MHNLMARRSCIVFCVPLTGAAVVNQCLLIRYVSLFEGFALCGGSLVWRHWHKLSATWISYDAFLVPIRTVASLDWSLVHGAAGEQGCLHWP